MQKSLSFLIIFLFCSSAFAGPHVQNSGTNTADSVVQYDGANSNKIKSGPSIGTSANNLVQLNSSAQYPAADGSLITGIVTGPSSPTAGSLTKWGPSGKALVDGPKVSSTFTDGKTCIYTTADGIICNTDASGSATVTVHTAAYWTSNNPTMSNGELGLESDTRKMKIGDGATAWASLYYIPQDSSGNLDISGSLTTGGSGDSYIVGNLGIGTTTPASALDLGSSGNITLYAQRSASGTRYLCINTTGQITSSSSACSGT